MRRFGRFAQSTPEQESPREPSAWEDNFGRLATSCIQTAALLALISVGLFLIVPLPLLLDPVIIALILASALNPLLRRFRAANFPMALATPIVLVSILGVFGLIAWLVSWTVVNQWDDLEQSAREGIDQIRELAGDLPFNIDDAQIDEWREKLTDFLTSGAVGAGAIRGVSAAAPVATGLEIG